MKHSNRLLVVVIIFATAMVLWALPPIVKKATDSPSEYPFVYYSSVLKELCEIEYGDSERPMTDKSGNRYTTAEFDTLMPLFNYRQLMADGIMPDSIDGVEVTPQILRTKQVVYRYSPTDIHSPKLGLYGLLESMPLRVGLKAPKDLFRIDNNIEFINGQTNDVDYPKSKLFGDMLEKRGYSFPAQWAVGDANTRKAYDEGYFSLDAKGQLFHIKMVNSRPYVRNTLASDKINIAHFSIYPAADKRFYGFILSVEGDVYILEGEAGKYTPLKLDIPRINIDKDQLIVMGNMLYWTISVANESGKEYHALNSTSLLSVDTHQIEHKESLWSEVSRLFFPFYITLEDDNSEYIYPRIIFGSILAWAISIVLAVTLLFTNRKTKPKERIFRALIVAISGLSGLIALLSLPNFRK